MKKLIIEIDGGYHNLPEQYEYDLNRTYELEELGLKVLRFTNEEVLFNIESTINIIKDEISRKLQHPHYQPPLYGVGG